MKTAAVIATALFWATSLWAQAPGPTDSHAIDPTCKQAQNSSPSQEESQADKRTAEGKPDKAAEDPCASQSEDESKGKQTSRMLWVVPNFAAVSANTKLPSLTAKGKFWLATEDSFDYSSFVWTGIIAGQEFGLKNVPEFGQGMAGYARYYWHNFLDGVSGTYFTEAIVPWITREDPRYYTMEHGSVPIRIVYALSRVVLTKTDSGGTTFNWSEVGGNALEAGLSNAYYPAQERGGRQTAINWGAQMESAALNNLAKEFWPDIRRLIFRQK
jgi:hypothetical protein